MIFLLTNRPNWIVPVFRQTGFIIEYKRFPADYMWRPFLDLSGLEFDPTDINDAISALDARTDDLETAIVALAGLIADTGTVATNAQTDATTALANAATAQAAADAAQATATAAAAAAATAASYLPDNALLLPMNFKTLVGGFTAPVLQAGQHLAQYSTLSANGDRSTAIVSLSANTYTMEISYIKGANLGRLNVVVDGGTPLLIDQYNATTLLSQRSVTSLGALSAGNHTIEVGVSGKNGSSSGFACHMSYLAIRPT